MVKLSEQVEITEKERKWMRAEYDKVYGEVMQQWAKKYGTSSTEPPKIVYVMNIYEERMPQVKTCIKRVRPHVDRCIIVVDDSVTRKSKNWLRKYNCEIHYRKWDNHFSKQRNAYLDPLKEGEWVLVSDPDELHSETLVKNLRKICAEADKQGINMLGINSHDLTIHPDNSQTNVVSNWFKNLLFKFEEGVRYVGCVHETLLQGIHGWRPANLDKKYYYEHIKSYVEVKERGARNVFCGGGGNNVLDRNPMYVELHTVTDKYGAKDWPTLRDFLRMPFKHRKETEWWTKIKEIAIKHRNDSGWDWENESRDLFLWLKAIHPDEFKDWESSPQPPSKGSPAEVMSYVEEQYLKVLGRNADDVGKQSYTQAILQGQIKREDLLGILKNSDEYKTKVGREHGLGRN